MLCTFLSLKIPTNLKRRLLYLSGDSQQESYSIYISYINRWMRGNVDKMNG